MTNIAVKEFKAMQSQLLDIEMRLEEAKVWKRLRVSEHGEIMFMWIMAQIQACAVRFEAEELDFAGFRALQARMRVLRQLATAGDQSDDQIAAWEKRAGALRREIKQRQDTGLDRDFSRPAQPEQGTS